MQAIEEISLPITNAIGLVADWAWKSSLSPMSWTSSARSSSLVISSAMLLKRTASALIDRNNGTALSTSPAAFTIASPICLICGVNERTSNSMMAFAVFCI